MNSSPSILGCEGMEQTQEVLGRKKSAVGKEHKASVHWGDLTGILLNKIQEHVRPGSSLYGVACLAIKAHMTRHRSGQTGPVPRSLGSEGSRGKVY